MLVECAVVTKITPDSVRLKSVRKSACVRCAEGKGCGGGVIAQLVRQPNPEIILPLPEQKRLSIGQRVEMSAPVQSILALAAILYLVPLIALFAGALVGSMITPNALVSVMGAAIGLLLVILLLRQLQEPIHRYLLFSRIQLEPTV